jgi:hypothetical protein
MGSAARWTRTLEGKAIIARECPRRRRPRTPLAYPTRSARGRHRREARRLMLEVRASSARERPAQRTEARPRCASRPRASNATRIASAPSGGARAKGGKRLSRPLKRRVPFNPLRPVFARCHVRASVAHRFAFVNPRPGSLCRTDTRPSHAPLENEAESTPPYRCAELVATASATPFTIGFTRQSGRTRT